MARLLAPDGSKIVGTFDRIEATARILDDSFTLAADGTFDFDYEGGTDVDWDSQVTITRKGETSRKPERVFVDEDGGEWLESELSLEEDEED